MLLFTIAMVACMAVGVRYPNEGFLCMAFVVGLASVWSIWRMRK